MNAASRNGVTWLATAEGLRELRAELGQQPDLLHAPLLTCPTCCATLSLRWQRGRRAFSVYHGNWSDCSELQIVHLAATTQTEAIAEFNAL